MQFPIFIELHRSRLFLFLSLALHGLAFLGVWLTPWDERVQFFLCAILLLSLYLSLRFWWQGAARLLLQEQGNMAIAVGREAGEPVPVERMKQGRGEWVLPWCCLLYWRPEGQSKSRRTLLVMADSTDQESLRRLRLWMRHTGG